MSKAILFVLTSNDRLGHTGASTGTWLEELAGAYYPLVAAGHRVSLASIKGGEAPLDPASLGDPWMTDAGKRFLSGAETYQLLKTTAPIAEVDPDAYDAIYMVGGAGGAWDFPRDAALTRVLGVMTKQDKVLAGICHGVTAFLNPVDGTPIARGRKMTAISDAEEEMIGYASVVPVLPESGLRNAGAIVTVAPPLEGHSVRDGKFITGQNPASASLVASSMIEALSD